MKKWLALISALPLLALAAPQEKIVALGGDVTEIVYALGAASSLVARDSTSQWPQAANTLPDVGYLRQLNAEGILSMRPTLVLASAQAQPSLALKQVEQSHVRVITVPAGNDLSVIDERFGLSLRRHTARQKGKPCAARCVRRCRRFPRHRSINGCCLFSTTAG